MRTFPVSLRARRMRLRTIFHALVLATAAALASAAEVTRELNHAGPSSTTPHLVLLAEGYRVSEQERFFSDASRLVGETFLQETAAMRDVASLITITAVFVPSHHHGIPRGAAADTTFQLYREGEEIRSILPSPTSYAKARAACKHAAPRCAARRPRAPGPASRARAAQSLYFPGPRSCDFVVILCNDPFYGGLGDQVIIATASPTSCVLRPYPGPPSPSSLPATAAAPSPSATSWRT